MDDVQWLLHHLWLFLDDFLHVSSSVEVVQLFTAFPMTLC